MRLACYTFIKPMPQFLRSIFSSRKDTIAVNRYEGFNANGAVVLREVFSWR
jgi:hypothetical protein